MQVSSCGTHFGRRMGRQKEAGEADDCRGFYRAPIGVRRIVSSCTSYARVVIPVMSDRIWLKTRLMSRCSQDTGRAVRKHLLTGIGDHRRRTGFNLKLGYHFMAKKFHPAVPAAGQSVGSTVHVWLA